MQQNLIFEKREINIQHHDIFCKGYHRLIRLNGSFVPNVDVAAKLMSTTKTKNTNLSQCLTVIAKFWLTLIVKIATMVIVVLFTAG